MTQLLHIFRDCGLISKSASKRRKSTSSPALQRVMAEEYSMRYEAAIEKCPLLMSFEQFHRFLDSLLDDDPSAEMLTKLARLVLCEGERYDSHWLHIHPECAADHSVPSPLQLESVISTNPELHFFDQSSLSSLPLSSNGLRSARSVALIWERNVEQVGDPSHSPSPTLPQMKQLYNYYSLSHSNSLSKKKSNLFVTFESYRELLQDFDLFPSIVDQKVLPCLVFSHESTSGLSTFIVPQSCGNGEPFKQLTLWVLRSTPRPPSLLTLDREPHNLPPSRSQRPREP
jgi:hypothetical protein